jgi:hypothetical protein
MLLSYFIGCSYSGLDLNFVPIVHELHGGWPIKTWFGRDFGGQSEAKIRSLGGAPYLQLWICMLCKSKCFKIRNFLALESAQFSADEQG